MFCLSVVLQFAVDRESTIGSVLRGALLCGMSEYNDRTCVVGYDFVLHVDRVKRGKEYHNNVAHHHHLLLTKYSQFSPRDSFDH